MKKGSKASDAKAVTQGLQEKNGTPSEQDAVALLKSDHRKVEDLFQKYKSASSQTEKAELCKQICRELIIHTKLEEEIFYRACREKNVEHDLLDEAQVEHDGAKVLIRELMEQSPNDEYFDAKVTVLSEYIKHHVGEEEKPSDGIFATAQKAGLDMNALGKQIQTRKTELMAKAESQGLNPPAPRSLNLNPNPNRTSLSNLEDQEMSGQYYRERDDQGRFTSDDDDDRRGSSRGSYQSRNRYSNEEDRNGGGNYRGNDRDRDDQGRFMSDDDRQRYSGRNSGGRDYDEDERSSSRGRGGYSDREAYRETADRGWEPRGRQASSRGRSDYSDRDDDQRNSGGRGWYGDSEGHSEASQRGWESRGHSHSRRDDDQDYGNHRGSSRSSQGHGGWSGDPRGHSEAARRGWQNRE